MSKISLLTGFYLIIFHLPLAGQIKDKWNGSVTFTQKVTGPYIKFNIKKITVTIVDNRVTGMITWDSDNSLTTEAGTLVMTSSCAGEGEGKLHRVDINELSGDYSIDIVSPPYTCTGNYNGKIGTSSGGTDGIAIRGTRSETNPNLLSGTKTSIADIGADMKGTTTIAWSLHRGPIDAVLIVTPVDYNSWKPFATIDELRKGNVMDINLKVQKRNGGDSPFKVVRFELIMKNTSVEKGTTLNFPLDPSPDQLPDLRFLPHNAAESLKPDQSIEINSLDGKTGTAIIGSYDGGGWTTLTAVAILEGGMRIEGTLATPTGVKEIPIPKRNSNSKIAVSWLAIYGNPTDTADHEKAIEHGHKGDGLSAYEEYRGVITKGEFRRLDPTKKELGVRINKTDAKLFEYGISMFEKATGLMVVRFDETEINIERDFNKNGSNAHVYDQFVLWLKTGCFWELDTDGSLRKIAGKAYNGPDIPTIVSPIVIDTAEIGSGFRYFEDQYRMANAILPFTQDDFWGGTIAHELGHGVNVYHHGISSVVPQNDSAIENSVLPYIIRNIQGTVITTRTYYMLGRTGKPQSQQSGDLSCFMAYNPYFDWALHDNILTKEYFEVPLLPLGTKMCKSAKGTGLNMNGKYFGDALRNANPARGNCLSQIKLK